MLGYYTTLRIVLTLPGRLLPVGVHTDHPRSVVA
jgi:hypothetical protein